MGGDPARYEFSYVAGARGVHQLAEFMTVPGFPELDAPYRLEQLFPFFQNRLMNPRRPEREEYLRQLELDPAPWDPVSELAAPFNHAHSNSVEVFRTSFPTATAGSGRSSWCMACVTPTPTLSNERNRGRSGKS